MKIITGSDNVDAMLNLYGTVKRGVETVARGSKTRNVHNAIIVLDAKYAPITSFGHRNLNLDYCKREWLWYLGADKFDDSIEKYASAWAKIKQPDGSYFSNYGQYLFAKEEPTLESQFEYVLKTLRDDPNSRRASIVLLQPYHLFKENVDTVCTYAINFTIEKSMLHMTVMMRSNDVIFGFTNDAFCFWHLYLYAYTVLKHYMPELRTGQYVHMANSMHVYERHYQMISNITYMGRRGFKEMTVPLPTAKEAMEIIKSKGKSGSGKHYEWLTTFQSGERDE